MQFKGSKALESIVLHISSFIAKREKEMLKLLGSSSVALLAMVACLLALESAIVSAFDYLDALDKTLLFFEAQRSGKLPPNQRVKWRGDSGLEDGFLQGVNLVGGYYDAGDHVKFGQPMAFAMTMLSWGCIEYRDEIVQQNQMGNTLAAIKWGTDYFIKAHTQPNVLWGEVGDGDSDHYCWERPEDMTTPRTGYKIDPEHPGSDLAGETAAALAAASLAFKPYNSSYSNLLLVHAKQLFSFADRFRGLYDDSIPCAQNFYPSSGYADELLWAAAWLYRATLDDNYLKYVVENAGSLGGTGWAVREFSWDNKYAGVQVLLSKVLLDGSGGAYTSTLKQYKSKADYFACACVQKNGGYNVATTPGGLVYVREWNNMQYVSSAAFLLAVYSDYLSKAHASVVCPDGQTQPQDLLNFAQSQADYILGKNPKSMSYLVGYGQNYSIQVHHRGASISSIYVLQSTIGCVEGFENWYRRPEANPNVIYGGLVGGPNKNDEFIDDRSNYEQTEPTISGTAPLFGLFCKLQSVYGNSGYNAQGSKRAYENKAGTDQESPKPYKTTTPVTSHQESPKPMNYSSTPSDDVPVHFYHSITDTWTIGTMTYYRHKVIMKNVSQKPIKDLKLALEGLSGSLWGLSPTGEKNVYELPQWLKVVQPGSDCTFVYIQGGSQAKVTVQSYQS